MTKAIALFQLVTQVIEIFFQRGRHTRMSLIYRT